MRLDDDFDEFSKGKFQTTAIALGVVTVIAVIALIFIINMDKNGNSGTSVAVIPSFSETSVSETSISETFHTSSTLTPADLDFYEMYPVGDDLDTSNSTSNPETVEEPEETDPSKDGKHTLLKYGDGSEEWVEISEYITQNNYDFLRLENQDGIMQYLNENGKIVSYFGVDISKDQGYIDFNKLKKAGVNYVMIRVGARGYLSGQLTLDEYFKDNFKRANDAGIDVGIYFLSQAVTEDEAKEEAELVLENIKGKTLDYPIAYVMTYQENENSRVEVLTRSEKTAIARTFLDIIEDAGYKPMIYGSKVWLIKYLELSKLADYDVWLCETEDLPSYPYRFTMWQYNNKGSIDGIAGEVSFNLSFVDYSLR